MLAHWTSRLGLTHLVAALVLVLVLCTTITLSAIDDFRRNATLLGGPALHDFVRSMSREQTAHRSLERSAASAWADAVCPFSRLTVIDASGQQVFDSEPRGLGTATGTALIALARMPPLQAPIRGGLAVVSPSPKRLLKQVASSVLWTAPAMLAAVFGLSRLLAIQTRRRESALALRSLSQGDFAQKPIVPGGPPEVNAITAAYGAFALNLQRAVAERERAADRIRTFVSDAGHELKTPLTIIMGYVDAVAKGLVSDPKDAQRILEKTLSECRRMRSTIEKLLLLARLDRDHEDQVHTVDVAALAQEIAESMRPLAPGLHVEVPSDGVEARAVADESDVREAIVNIIDNAIKYAPRSPIDVHVMKPGDYIVVEVADDGPGMTAEDRAHAFERFHRGNTSGDVEGSGLGLAIAKQGIERAHGRIALASEPGRGTTVTIYLPCRAADTPIQA